MGGVFKSTDCGEQWSEASTGMTGASAFAIVIEPSSQHTVYAGTSVGVFKSTNHGDSWSGINVGLRGGDVRALVMDTANPNTLYAGVAGGSGGVFKSGDSGATWTCIQAVGWQTGPVNAVATDPRGSHAAYAGTAHGDVLKITDAGTTWNRLEVSGQGLEIRALVIDDSGFIYAGTKSGAFKSADGGTSWSSFNNGLTNTDVNALVIAPSYPPKIYAGTWGGGVFESGVEDANWSYSGLANLWIRVLAVDPSNPLTIYAASGPRLFKTTDAGETWNEVAEQGMPNSSVASLAVDPADPQTLYAGTDSAGISVRRPLDSTPPVLFLPANLTVEATGPTGAPVTFSASANDDHDGWVPVTCSPASGSTFPLGTTTVTCSATDAAANTATGTFTVTVADTTPPVIEVLAANPSILWPPNHQFVPIALTVSATDNYDKGPTCRITGVMSNEPINSLGDGNTAPDWVVSDGLELSLRAERSGRENGRVYSVTVTCTDSNGNASSGTTSVMVPKSQAKK
jgi:photosystem II stability/assembly factor-like uncharacterized protein